MSNFVAKAGARTLDRNVRQLWRDGWNQIPEVMISICIGMTGVLLYFPTYFHKARQGPRDFKYRHLYEVIRKDEVPPYLKPFPDCVN